MTKQPIRMPKGIAKFARITCGCATVEATWGLVLAELERLERSEFKPNDDLVTSVVDYCGMSEHGTSIRGGWLTDDGRESLAFLRAHGIDWQDKGEFIDDEDVSWGKFA